VFNLKVEFAAVKGAVLETYAAKLVCKRTFKEVTVLQKRRLATWRKPPTRISGCNASQPRPAVVRPKLHARERASIGFEWQITDRQTKSLLVAECHACAKPRRNARKAIAQCRKKAPVVLAFARHVISS
jgi:hypothetical protein